MHHVRTSLRMHRTQLAALGVNNDYINYMMGHQVDTYHDIKMKGPEFLRGVYAASGLGIKTKTQLSKMETLKQVARAWGLDPEKILVSDASVYPHRSYASTLERDEVQSQRLSEALREAVRKDLLTER